MYDLDSEWRRKGATLSHKTAHEEFGPTWEQIVRAIRAFVLHIFPKKSKRGISTPKADNRSDPRAS